MICLHTSKDLTLEPCGGSLIGVVNKEKTRKKVLGFIATCRGYHM